MGESVESSLECGFLGSSRHEDVDSSAEMLRDSLTPSAPDDSNAFQSLKTTALENV